MSKALLFKLSAIFMVSCNPGKQKGTELSPTQQTDLLNYSRLINFELEEHFAVLPLSGCNTCIETSIRILTNMTNSITLIIPVENAQLQHEFSELLIELSGKHKVIYDTEFKWSKFDIGTIAPAYFKLNDTTYSFVELSSEPGNIIF
jgi:hypothetical protein